MHNNDFHIIKESPVIIICTIYTPPVNIYSYSPMNIIQNKRKHILNKQQQRFLKKTLLLVTQEVINHYTRRV